MSTTPSNPLSLREEYTQKQQANQVMVEEAAYRWLEENVIYINEKINRNSVNRLISSISKFEETFGPYRDKIPSLTSVLEGAEDNLQQVLTGKASDKRASDLLEYLSFVYNVFSGFFAKDLPVVLKTRVFAIPRENPSVRLDSLSGGSGFDASIAAKTFSNALKPSDDEVKLLGKVLKSKALPKLDYNKVAMEMLGLSYNDLVELTNVSRTPLVTTPALEEDVAINEEGTKEVLEEQGGAAGADDLATAGQRVAQLKQIATKAGLNASLSGAISKLHGDIIKFEGSDLGSKFKAQFDQLKGVAASESKSSLADLFKTPGGKLLKQANMAIELFTAIGNAYPNMKDILDKEDITDADLNNLRAILTKKVGGGILKRAAQAFNVTTQPYPGLDPESVVYALVTAENDHLAPSDSDQNTRDNEASQALEKLRTSMMALNQFAKSSGGQGTATTAPTAGTQASANTDTSGGSSTQPTQGSNTGNKGTSPQDSGTAVSNSEGGPDNEIIDKTLKAIGKDKNQQARKQLVSAIAALKKAGYTLS